MCGASLSRLKSSTQKSAAPGNNHHVYGSRSRRGTEVAALFYSLIESAKLAGVGPHTYLKIATEAALRGAKVQLPHEVAAAAPA
jgi:transposase